MFYRKFKCVYALTYITILLMPTVQCTLMIRKAGKCNLTDGNKKGIEDGNVHVPDRESLDLTASFCRIIDFIICILTLRNKEDLLCRTPVDEFNQFLKHLVAYTLCFCP